MNKILFIALLLIFSTISFWSLGQESTIEISGTIIEAETKNPVPYVHIVSKSKGAGTVSNTEGRFWITINKDDTILFSAIGFEPYAFTIKDQVTSNKLVLTIELNTSTMELQPVKVFAYKDEQALKRAMIAMDVPVEDDNEVFVSGWSRSKHFTPDGSFTMKGPVSMLHDAFSKKAKANRKLQKYKIEYDYQKMIRAKYNERVVIELTGLPEDKVEEFMNFCKLDESFVNRSSSYDIAVAVNRCLTKFTNTEGSAN